MTTVDDWFDAPSPDSATQISPVVASIMRKLTRAWKVLVRFW